MARSNVFRIMMAMLLATWSPLWCHCVLLAAAAGPSHGHDISEVAICSIDGGTNGECAVSECCADVTNVQLAVVEIECCPDSCDPHSAECMGECQCCDSSSGAAISQASASALVNLRFSALAELPGPMAWSIITDVLRMRLEPAPRGPCAWQGASLLSQRCMLVI